MYQSLCSLSSAKDSPYSFTRFLSTGYSLYGLHHTYIMPIVTTATKLPSLVEVDQKDEVISEDSNSVGRWHDDDECKDVINKRIEGLQNTMMQH